MQVRPVAPLSRRENRICPVFPSRLVLLLRQDKVLLGLSVFQSSMWRRRGPRLISRKRERYPMQSSNFVPPAGGAARPKYQLSVACLLCSIQLCC
jgi:hypothetical protein